MTGNTGFIMDPYTSSMTVTNRYPSRPTRCPARNASRTIAAPSLGVATTRTLFRRPIADHRATVLRRRDEAEHLGDDIAELAARIQAATYELLVLIRAFDERKGWSGFKSCALVELAHRAGPGSVARKGARGSRVDGPSSSERGDPAGTDLLFEGTRPDTGGDPGERAAAAQLRPVCSRVLRRAAGACMASRGSADRVSRRAAKARAAEPDHLGRRRWDGRHPRPTVARSGCGRADGRSKRPAISFERTHHRKKLPRPASASGRRTRWACWPRARWPPTSTGERRATAIRWCCMSRQSRSKPSREKMR